MMVPGRKELIIVRNSYGITCQAAVYCTVEVFLTDHKDPDFGDKCTQKQLRVPNVKMSLVITVYLVLGIQCKCGILADNWTLKKQNLTGPCSGMVNIVLGGEWDLTKSGKCGAWWKLRP